MNIRENVHQLVDALPEDCLDDVIDCLAEFNERGAPLSAETRAAIAEGLDDICNGRTVSLEDYRRTRGL